jgi:hypothetical protein
MAGAAWKLTCSASRRTSPLNWTADSIWATLKPTGEIVERMPCCKRNGYLVLRFLSEDVGKYLDQVLDAILRALPHQNVRI